MKTVLLIMRGNDFPENAFSFIGALNERSPILLKGLVLPEMVRIENWAAYSATSAGSLKDVTEQVNTLNFEKKCKNYHIEYRIHHGTNELGVPQIVKETRFADIMIASPATFYKEGNNSGYHMLRQVMRQAECPTLIIPDKFRFPERLLLAYDGSEASVFAIKQFAYLFPELNKLETILIHIGDTEDGIPHRDRVEEWLKGHFPNYSLVTVEHEMTQYFDKGVNGKPVLIVTGSFGRTTVSEWVHPSFSEELVSKYQLLLFSCHGI